MSLKSSLKAAVCGLVMLTNVQGDVAADSFKNFEKVVHTDEIDPEKQEEFGKDFDEFDANKDGFIDAHEILAGFNGQVEAKDMFDFFKQADGNSDGLVNRKEYFIYAQNLAGSSSDSTSSDPA